MNFVFCFDFILKYTKHACVHFVDFFDINNMPKVEICYKYSILTLEMIPKIHLFQEL